MSQKVNVIGGGINGLVAAFYLRMAGLEVTLFERKETLGGACTSDRFTTGGISIPFPTGASVLGMMQDFVFRDTGLSNRIEVCRPAQPTLVYFGKEPNGTRLFDDEEQARAEWAVRWGEDGNPGQYRSDLEKVTGFLVSGIAGAEVPSRSCAREMLGADLVSRWFDGSARDLLNTYFTSEKLKVVKAMAVTESGPVSLDAPGSAFNIALMNTGTVFGGSWGFVKGGLWTLVEELEKILWEKGVQIVKGAEVTSLNASDTTFLATDPITAARLVKDEALLDQVRGKRYRGSSGKCVLFFKRPVRWRDRTDAPFRFFYEVSTVEELERSTRAILEPGIDFSPSCFQVYCEGWAMRQMGWSEGHDYLSVFFKDLAWNKPADQLGAVQEFVEELVLSRIENPEDLLGSRIYAPKDLERTFLFPEGNIDHLELSRDQNFFARTFSADPEGNFYQFGNYPNLFYCGAGSYPCGSVAGTSGYLAAIQFLKKAKLALL